MNMFFLIIFMLLSSQIFSQTTVININQKTEKKTIAVMPFTSIAKGSSYSGVRMQKDVEDALRSSQTLYKVADSDIVNIYLEGKDKFNAVEFGRTHGYDLVVYGSLSPFRSSSRWEWAYPNNEYDEDVYVTTTTISAKLYIMDVNKGEVRYYGEISGENRVESRRSFFIDLSQNIATKKHAYSSLVTTIKGRMKSVFRLTAQIEDINNNGDIILPLGNQYGVRTGQRFKVYKNDDESVLEVGDFISETYKPIGTVRIKSNGDDYSVAKALRPFDIEKSDVVREIDFSGFTFELYSTFGAYKISGYKNTTISDKGSGKLNIGVPELEYSYSLYLGMGATVPATPLIFIPTVSLGVLFGDLFKTTWGLDTRINLEFQIPVYYELINISIIPFMSFAFTFSEIGYVSDGDYYFDTRHIKNGSRIRSNDFFFGAGILGIVRFNFTDNFGLSLGAGYKFYMDRINMRTYAWYDDGIDSDDINNISDVELEDTPNYLIDLTGLEVMLAFNFMF